MEHKIQWKVDLDAGAEFHEGRVAVVDDAGGPGLRLGVPAFGPVQRAQRHGIGLAVVQRAENHGAIAGKANVLELRFVRCHILASILQWPRLPALRGAWDR